MKRILHTKLYPRLMITVDGSRGEGGGQILRTTVAMSVVNETPIRITNIRKNRPNPGLSNQHMTALKAVAEICHGDLRGAEKGSPEIMFDPGVPSGGSYQFDIGTAGSITLFLQCVLPVLISGGGEYEIRVKGGTDVKWSPPYDFFENVFLEHLRRMSLEVRSELLKRGHYPKGGGEVILTAKSGSPGSLDTGDEIRTIRGKAFVTSLDEHIMRRMRKKVLKEFVDIPVDVKLGSYESSSPGTGITLWTEGERILGVGKLGEVGVPAERIGKEAADHLRGAMESGFHLDRWSADQLIPYLAMSKGHGEIRIGEPSGHLKTNVWTTDLFIPDGVIIEERDDGFYILY